ncbi:hypothetical protein L0F63_005873 [Massospora cicadina]|nr:hypothetical protein L0F63_005873 [Massospora cicadina]
MRTQIGKLISRVPGSIKPCVRLKDRYLSQLGKAGGMIKSYGTAKGSYNMEATVSRKALNNERNCNDGPHNLNRWTKPALSNQGPAIREAGTRVTFGRDGEGAASLATTHLTSLRPRAPVKKGEAKCKRACDRCRFKRVRCRREGECCLRCLKDNKACMFADEEKKRGPKPKSESPKKRSTRAKSATSPNTEATVPTEELDEHNAHTRTFFGTRELVALYIQSYIQRVDPTMNLVTPTLMRQIMVSIPGLTPSTQPPISLVFLLRCMVSCTVLIATSNPLDDLFLIHYDMAVKALRIATCPNYVEAISAGIHLLSFIESTLLWLNNNPALYRLEARPPLASDNQN